MYQLCETIRQLEQSSGWERRKPLLERLDVIFGKPESENDPFIRDFYRSRCWKVLEEIRAFRGPGVRLWKLYSSAVIVKESSGRVTAFDLNDGCAPMERRSRLLLGRELTEALAETIDRAIYTHRHLDHVGHGIADSLLARKKEIIAPRDTVRSRLLDGAIPAEDLRGREIRSFFGFQRIDHQPALPNAAYLATFETGVTLFVRGDIYRGEDLLPVLDAVEHVDYAAISPFYQSLPDPVAELDRRFHCNFLAIHEWEFGHRPQGNSGSATQCYRELYESFGKPGREGRAAILAWGESMKLEKTVSRRTSNEKELFYIN